LPVWFFIFRVKHGLAMKKINFAIVLTTLSLTGFIILCSFPFSFIFLQIYLFALTGCLIWMVVTILKNGQPSAHTFDERSYEDEDHGPALKPSNQTP
jgi:hypothetical protein